MNGLSRWLDILRAMRFLQLLLFSMAVLLVQALNRDSLLLSLVINLLYLNAMLVTLSASGAHIALRYGLVASWLLSLLLRLFAAEGVDDPLFLLSKAFGSLLLAVCITSLSHFLFFRSRISADSLFAAIVIYVLIAILFGQLYSIVYAIMPAAFTIPEALLASTGRLPDLSLHYFSFVTIATLGYGDIAPRHPLVQMLASIEAVIGQFYVAMVVARLVSLYAASTQGKDGA